MPLPLPAAGSAWGPSLCVAGVASLVAAGWVHGGMHRPTILSLRVGEAGRPPSFWERVSVHLIVYGVWGVAFGAIVWRGVPAGMIDVRLPFERAWPVWPAAEWIYASVYFVPAAMPWLAPTRGALRRYAFHLWWLLAISVVLFLILPLGAPPRTSLLPPDTLAEKLLAWETRRADFAAASFPSFHVFWGLLVAQLLATRGRGWAWVGGCWAVLVTFAAVANGAHALADVAASLFLFPLVAGARSPVARRFQAAADRFFFRSTMPAPSTAPSSSPPTP